MSLIVSAESLDTEKSLCWILCRIHHHNYNVFGYNVDLKKVASGQHSELHGIQSNLQEVQGPWRSA